MRRERVAHDDALGVAAGLVRGLVLIALMQDAIFRVFAVAPGVVDRKDGRLREATEGAEDSQIAASRKPRAGAQMDVRNLPAHKVGPGQKEGQKPDISACRWFPAGWHRSVPAPFSRSA